MENRRERAHSPIDVPPSMRPFVEGRRWARDMIGEAGAAVYRLSLAEPTGARRSAPRADDLYLKHGCGPVAVEVLDEAVRLRWLATYVTVPTIRHVEVTGGTDAPEQTWLMMDALQGRTASQLLAAHSNDDGRQLAIVDALVAFMHRLHAVPVEHCPFASDHERRLVHARARLDAGVIDTDDFGETHRGWTAAQVWDAMVALLPFVADPVVTHGDFSLDNLLLASGTVAGSFEVVGCLDAGRVGVADRYQDLAILWDCLSEYGSGLQQRLFSRYGITVVDELKLRFHLLLDECF